MRPIQKIAVGLLFLGVSAGVSSSHAAPVRPRARPASPAARGFVAPLWNMLVAAWSRTGYQIDPYGRSLPVAQEPAVPAGTAADDPNGTGCQIDPLGGCPAGL